MKKFIDIEESKEIQLSILRAVHVFCISNGIKYSLGYGSLLGAIRHKGFIPWDDDIDIIMKREDYNRFILLFHDDKGIIKLHSLDNDNKHKLPYVKIEDSRTILEENTHASTIGVAIDLFPYDDVGNTEEEAVAFLNRIKWVKTLFRAKLLKLTKRNGFMKKIAISLLKALLLFVPLRYLAERVSMRAQSQIGNKYLADAVASEGPVGIIQRSCLEDVALVSFENEFFYAMNNYDSYLTSVYGDYLKLPPFEKRQSPHSIKKVYWR